MTSALMMFTFLTFFSWSRRNSSWDVSETGSGVRLTLLYFHHHMSLSGAQGWESELQVCEDVQHGRVRRHLGRSPWELPQVTLTKNWYDQTKYHRYMLQNFFKHIDIDPKVKWDFCDCNIPFLERARSGRQRSWFSRGVCWLRAEDCRGEVSF